MCFPAEQVGPFYGNRVASRIMFLITNTHYVKVISKRSFAVTEHLVDVLGKTKRCSCAVGKSAGRA